MNTTMAAQITKLQELGIKDLQAKYEEVFGKPTKSRNAAWLFKVIARKLQDGEEPDSAKGPVPLPTLVAKYDRKKKARSKRITNSKKSDAKKSGSKKTQHRQPGERDPRLPKSGTTITRPYKGHKLLVRVLESSFEYEGREYRSLSALAKHITGQVINGFAFFQLNRESKTP